MKNIIVVTGASSGIGKEFALALDSYGADEIWGFALDKEGLEETKKMLKTKFVGFSCDLTKPEIFEEYTQKLQKQKCNVTVLVNCSGYGKFGRYDEIKLDSTLGMVDLNCRALVKMTEITLPFMQEGARIVNIASVASFQPIPYINVYGATKAFVLSYSRALNIELRNRKISVTCVCPFWTKTNFFKRAVVTENPVVSKYIVMYDTKKVVKTAMKATKKRKMLCIPGFISKMQVLLVKLLPAKTIMKIWVRQQKLDKKYKNK